MSGIHLNQNKQSKPLYTIFGCLKCWVKNKLCQFGDHSRRSTTSNMALHDTRVGGLFCSEGEWERERYIYRLRGWVRESEREIYIYRGCKSLLETRWNESSRYRCECWASGFSGTSRFCGHSNSYIGVCARGSAGPRQVVEVRQWRSTSPKSPISSLTCISSAIIGTRSSSSTTSCLKSKSTAYAAEGLRF